MALPGVIADCVRSKTNTKDDWLDASKFTDSQAWRGLPQSVRQARISACQAWKESGASELPAANCAIVRLTSFPVVLPPQNPQLSDVCTLALERV